MARINSHIVQSVLATVLLTCSLHITSGFKHYKDRIPNGERVPNPCKPNYLWKGVGHKNVRGAGARNRFGEDFASNGHEWTAELCMMDSDSDGRTNGEELGDPDCKWRPGDVPTHDRPTHPGVCEPLDKPECREINNWDFCERLEFVCPSIHERDVFSIEIRFPPTKVPATETNYRCMVFDLADYGLNPDEIHHLVAVKALIDNEEVMHHIILYSCPEQLPAGAPPVQCFMGGADCPYLLGGWTVGTTGQCYDNMGFVVGGRHGVKKVKMEFHWNNPLLFTNYTDSSGMVFYLTKKLKPFNAGILMTGQEYLEIPPGQNSLEFVGRCKGICTKHLLKGPIKVVRVLNHMHYLGHSAVLEHHRNGKLLQILADEPDYSYDSPIWHNLDPHVEILPGDELVTKCYFKSLGRPRTVYFGEGTSSEMCFSFLIYYPFKNTVRPYCKQYKGVDSCLYADRDPDLTIDNCPIRKFISGAPNVSEEIFGDLLDNCALTSCRDGCQESIAKAKKHVCLRGDIGEYVEYRVAERSSDYKWLMALHSCDANSTTTSQGTQAQIKLSYWIICTMLLIIVSGVKTNIF